MIDGFINRQISDNILKDSRFAPVITVTGPRQSGKTTLVRHLFKDYQYFNFELPLTRAEFLSDPLNFLNKSENGIIIDEFQHVPDLLSYIQVLSDENEKPGRFVLTGSQNFVMLERISQSLAGRASLFTLLPFSYSELQMSGKQQDDLNSIIFCGFYPRVVLAEGNAQSWYNNYINLYIQRDVRQIINVRDLEPYSVFLKLIAARAGNILNFSEIAGLIGKDIKTIKSWVKVLEISNIIFLLKPYYRNFNKRIIKSQKLYFHDTGLLCALLNINAPSEIEGHSHKGNIFENFVMAEIVKTVNNRNIKCDLYFWNERNKKEIDLILDYGNRLKLIEIKSGGTLNDKQFNYLDDFAEFSLMPIESNTIIYTGETMAVQTVAIRLNWKDLEKIIYKMKK